MSLIPFLYNVLVVGGVLVAIGIGAWKVVDTYNDAIEGRTAAEKESKDLRENLDVANLQVDKLREMGIITDTLRKRDKKELQHERDKSNEFEQALNEAKEKDPSVKAWMDTPIPSTVRSMRRDARNSVRPSGEVLSGDRATGGNPGTSNERRDQ